MESDHGGPLKKVWTYFEVIDRDNAKCLICPPDPVTKQFTILKTTNRSTTGLHRHLEQHDLAAFKRKRRSKKEMQPAGHAPKRISLTYDALHDNSLDGQLARLVAKDRLSFLLIANSEDIREGIRARLKDSNIAIPQSHTAIKERVVKYAANTRSILKVALKTGMKESPWLSLDCDEWVSARRRRYLNISLFSKKDVYWNLGLVRISGSANTERLVELLDARLNEFGINLKSNIVGMTTDGAPVAKKMARVAGVIGQQCLAHGVNLAVCDVLYKKNQHEYQSSDEEDDDDEQSALDEAQDEGDNEGLLYQIEDEDGGSSMQSLTVHGIVAKVRKLCVRFKLSTIYRDRLQKYVQEKYNNPNLELQLLVDVKTRWSSMYYMLERFSKISDCVGKVLLDFEVEDSITAFDKTVVGAIVKALEPIMVIIKVLSQRDCNLLKARVGLKLALLQIWRQNNRFARYLALRLRTRIDERWETAAGALYYLKAGSYTDPFPEFNAQLNITLDDSDVDYFVDNVEYDEDMTEEELLKIFTIPSKAVLKKFIVGMLSRMCNKESLRVHVDAEYDAMEEENTPPIGNIPPELPSFEEVMAKEIGRADEDTCMNKPQESTLAKIISTEMDVFEKNKSRGAYLEKAFAMLMTIKASSVESERAFSSAGLICTKIRTRLGDKTLDDLCFLRSFFNNPSATSIPLS